MPLIVLEGIDGCGKTTQVERLVSSLQAQGIDPLLLREPGGTGLGERIREVLLDPQTVAGPVAELFGYQMARAQLVEERVQPALSTGQWVILDRFWYSTIAYQAYGLGLPVERVRQVIDLAVAGLQVDVAIYCRLDAAVAADRRALARGEDRIEQRGLDYLYKVVSGYEALVDEGVLQAVDATQDIDAVETAIWQLVAPLLGS